MTTGSAGHDPVRGMSSISGASPAQEILIDSTAEMIRLTDKAGQVLILDAAHKRIEARWVVVPSW